MLHCVWTLFQGDYLRVLVCAEQATLVIVCSFFDDYRLFHWFGERLVSWWINFWLFCDTVEAWFLWEYRAAAGCHFQSDRSIFHQTSSFLLWLIWRLDVGSCILVVWQPLVIQRHFLFAFEQLVVLVQHVFVEGEQLWSPKTGACCIVVEWIEVIGLCKTGLWGCQ